MTDALDHWQRNYYASSDSEAFLFFVAFGLVTPDQPLSRRTYRCNGIPDGFELIAYDRVRHGHYMAGFLNGYLWDQLVAENPDLASNVRQSHGCMVLRGSQRNPSTLDYLRDCVGLLTFFLDNGACAICDPQMLQWWSPQQWRERLFAPAAPVPRQHTVILHSVEEGPGNLTWVHTRGMRKFGRPDISVRRVGHEYLAAVTDLCERFIEYQALGGVIPEGQEVRMASLPVGGVARHGGGLDDLDFNNVHVEFIWPEPGLAGGCA